MTAEWIRTAKVGDEVVCIKRGPWINDIKVPGRNDNGPLYGQVCTIDLVEPIGEDVFFRLRGFHAYDVYIASQFKPIERRDSDISVFTDMLKAVDKPVTEVVA